MRYYRIELTDPKTGKVLKQPDGTPWVVTSKNSSGWNDPGALLVELDLPVYNFSTPLGGAFVRIWGVSLKSISQSANLNPTADGPKAAIAVYGGMSKGLPLAKPDQAGLLARGVIQQAFGNWQGVSQCLDLLMIPDSGTLDAPKNIVLTWAKGQKLTEALKTCLTTAFPDRTLKVEVKNDPQATETTTAAYSTLSQLADYVSQVSGSLSSTPVQMTIADKTIRIYDGTSKDSPKSISFVDLIGQPTWRSPYTIAFSTVMRGDLRVGDYVKLPNVQAQTTAQSQSQYRQNSIFQGSFQLNLVRHVGNSRSPDGADWVTTFEAAASG